jgi:hypothetical protein
MIESAAEKTGLRLGSRAVDLFRGTVRLSFEKEAQTGSRTRLRAPTFEFIREFVEDLPAQEEYHLAVVDFLESLSLRLIQTNAQEFLTLLVVPLSLEIHWPFRSEQSSDDEFIHVLGEGRRLTLPLVLGNRQKADELVFAFFSGRGTVRGKRAET